MPSRRHHQLEAMLVRESLLASLRVRRVGRNIVVLPEVDSTNRYVLDVLAPQRGVAADGWVVFAEYQTAGRGRLGRSWHSPRGAGLTFTVLLCEPADQPSEAPPPAPAQRSALSPQHSELSTPRSALSTRPSPSAPARLVMAAAVAVAAGIEEATDVQPEIRWPNDLYVRGKKLGGILIEAKKGTFYFFNKVECPLYCEAIAIGIGVNCLQHAIHFSPELRGQATSLDLESSHPVDRAAVARAILRQLDARLALEQSDDELAAAWRSRSTDLGAYVTLVNNGQTYSGRITDVQPRTGLRLQLDTGAPAEFDPATTTRV